MLALGTALAFTLAAAVAWLVYDVPVGAFATNTRAAADDFALVLARGALGSAAVGLGWQWIGTLSDSRESQSTSTRIWNAAGLCAAAILVEIVLSFCGLKLLLLLGTCT